VPCILHRQPVSFGRAARQAIVLGAPGRFRIRLVPWFVRPGITSVTSGSTPRTPDRFDLPTTHCRTQDAVVGGGAGVSGAIRKVSRLDEWASQTIHARGERHARGRRAASRSTQVDRCSSNRERPEARVTGASRPGSRKEYPLRCSGVAHRGSVSGSVCAGILQRGDRDVDPAALTARAGQRRVPVATLPRASVARTTTGDLAPAGSTSSKRSSRESSKPSIG
jgi:hypothetical protein